MIDDLVSALRLLAKPERLKFALRTYPSSLEILGVVVPDVRIVLAEMKRETASFSTEEKIELANQLLKRNCFELNQLTLEWIGRDSRVMKIISKTEAENMMLGMDNWVLVDTYSSLILGPLWQRQVFVDADIQVFAKHPDLWMRRMAVASTVALNRKRKGFNGDSKRTLLICEMLVYDKEDMVVKAVSWALRSLIPWDRRGVESFLNAHHNVLHKRIIREVHNKLDTGYKSKKKVD